MVGGSNPPAATIYIKGLRAPHHSEKPLGKFGASAGLQRRRDTPGIANIAIRNPNEPLKSCLRIGAARFPRIKSLGTFDFTGQPSLRLALVLELARCELARCEWIDKRQNRIGLGPLGRGKTPIGLALGLAACRKNQSVSFTTAAAFVHEFTEARDERRLWAPQKHPNTVKLLTGDV